MIADRILAWSLALALAFFPIIASVRNASALSQQQKQIVLHQSPVSAASGSATCSFADAQSADNNATTRTFNINIGTLAPDRLVIFALGIQASGLPSNIVASGVTFTTPVPGGSGTNGNTLAIYSSLVPTGSGVQTFTVNGVVGFEEVGISVWTCTGLASNTVKNANFQGGQPCCSPTPFSVSAGDFMFAMDGSANGSTTFAGSTQAPTAFHPVDIVGPNYNSAEWLPIIASNSAFSIAGIPAVTTSMVVATFR